MIWYIVVLVLVLVIVVFIYGPQIIVFAVDFTDGLWFRVFYEDLGFSECIKVPDVQAQGAGGRDQ